MDMDITSDNVFVYLECEFCTGLFPVDGIELHIKVGHEDEMHGLLTSGLVPVHRAFAVTELPNYKLHPACAGRDKSPTAPVPGPDDFSRELRLHYDNDHDQQNASTSSNAIGVYVKDECASLPDSEGECGSNADDSDTEWTPKSKRASSNKTSARKFDNQQQRQKSRQPPARCKAKQTTNSNVNFGAAVFCKSRNDKYMIRYESKYYACVLCTCLAKQSRMRNGPLLSTSIIRVENGIIMTDPDNPATPHHCKGYTGTDVCVHDAISAMRDHAYTNGAKVSGATAVWKYGKDQLEQMIRDLPDADKEQARSKFPNKTCLSIARRARAGCWDRREPLPEWLKSSSQRAKEELRLYQINNGANPSLASDLEPAPEAPANQRQSTTSATSVHLSKLNELVHHGEHLFLNPTSTSSTPAANAEQANIKDELESLPDPQMESDSEAGRRDPDWATLQAEDLHRDRGVPIEIRQMIVKHHQEGMSNKEIRELYNCRNEIVANVIHLWTVHKTLEGALRPKRFCPLGICDKPEKEQRENWGVAMFCKSRHGKDMIRYESEIYPDRCYEFCLKSAKQRYNVKYYTCVSCGSLSMRSRQYNGPHLPEPVIRVENGLIMTDPDNAKVPHHCQGISKVETRVRDAFREMIDYAESDGAKVGIANVMKFGRDRLERLTVDLSVADKERAKAQFHVCRRTLQRRIRRGRIKRGEPLPTAPVSGGKPKRIRAKVVPRAYLAGDGYVVNDVNYVQNSAQSEKRKRLLRRALEAGQTVESQRKDGLNEEDEEESGDTRENGRTPSPDTDVSVGQSLVPDQCSTMSQNLVTTLSVNEISASADGDTNASDVVIVDSTTNTHTPLAQPSVLIEDLPASVIDSEVDSLSEPDNDSDIEWTPNAETSAVRSSARKRKQPEHTQASSQHNDTATKVARIQMYENANAEKQQTLGTTKEKVHDGDNGQAVTVPEWNRTHKRNVIPIEVKEFIVNQHQAGVKNMDIAQQLNSSSKVISSVIYLWKNYGDLYLKKVARKRGPRCGFRPSHVPPKLEDTFGVAVFCKSRHGKDIVRCESEIYPGRFYEWCFKSRKPHSEYYTCVSCCSISQKSERNNGPKLPEPVIVLKNGLIATDPDNPTKPHHCQGFSKAEVSVRDVVTEMWECSYTRGAKLGSAGVWRHCKDRLEQLIVDLSDAEKVKARRLFPSIRNAGHGICRRIKQGCNDRGEPLPESFRKQYEGKNKSNPNYKPKRKAVPRAYLAGDGYVVNDVNYVQHSSLSSTTKYNLKRALKAGKTIENEKRRQQNSDVEISDREDEIN